MKPEIRKLGTIDCDMVETNPIVFNGRLYRFEYVRKSYPKNDRENSYFRLVDVETGEVTRDFAYGYHLGCAYVDPPSVFVTAVNEWDGEFVESFISDDLDRWDQHAVLHLPGYGIFNTSLCATEEDFVLMFEVGKPPEVAGQRFTARFARSRNLHRWHLTPPECTYSRDRYTAPHCFRYLNGYFYNFYLEAHDGYEQRVVRSRDLIEWEPSPLNPVLKASDEDRRIANPNLTAAERKRIATAENINNSDIDFCEYQGRVIINYSWGNQRGVEHLAAAEFHGTEAEFLEGWFPST